MNFSTSLSERPVSSLDELIAPIRDNPVAANERFYLLVDGARLKKVSEFLRSLPAGNWISLLGASLDTPLLDVSPVLISIGNDNHLAERMLKQPKYRGAVLLIVSTATLSELVENLSRHLYVEEQDGTRWTLAFWDPFVLPSLIVEGGNVNGLVPGPVLDSEQVGSLMARISCVVFQNRKGQLQGINIPTSEGMAAPPFVMRPEQIDQLMDIPLPGQVAETLLSLDGGNSSDETRLYSMCCDAIKNARREGLDTLADYCETALEMPSEKITTENTST